MRASNGIAGPSQALVNESLQRYRLTQRPDVSPDARGDLGVARGFQADRRSLFAGSSFALSAPSNLSARLTRDLLPLTMASATYSCPEMALFEGSRPLC